MCGRRPSRVGDGRCHCGGYPGAGQESDQVPRRRPRENGVRRGLLRGLRPGPGGRDPPCHRPDEGEHTMTTSAAANAELVRAGFRALNAGDVDECLTFITPDLVINLAELPEPRYGRETWRQGFEMMRRAFPDLEARIEDIVAAEDKVAVRVRFRGTHAGGF